MLVEPLFDTQRLEQLLQGRRWPEKGVGEKRHKNYKAISLKGF